MQASLITNILSMKLLAHVLVLLIAALGKVPGQPTAAPDTNSTTTSKPTVIKSPQVLYMERLHNLLKATEYTSKEEEIKVGGKLLATSIEASNVLGPGNTLEGMNMASGNTYTMEFSIPRQKEESVIQSAELWIFPRQLSQNQDSAVRMTLLVIVELEHANNPRREVMNVKWDRSMDCIALNLTSLSRKVSRNLEKKNLQQANITISVEVVSILAQPQFSTSGYLTDMCNALTAKQTKVPFLVVKYFAEKPNTMVPRKKRTPVSTEKHSNPGNCSVIPMVVDMTELYDFVLLPKLLDVKNCYGACNQLHSPEQYNNHGLTLERHQLLSGESIKRDVSCVPVSYESEELLIWDNLYGTVSIVKFPNFIVTECACR